MLEQDLESVDGTQPIATLPDNLLHEDLPLEYIQRVFSVMNQAKWHRYQVRSLWLFPDGSPRCSLQEGKVRRLHRKSGSQERPEGINLG